MNPEYTKIASSAGLIHFVGIGGIGMSGIAEILHTMGVMVQGSDLKENQNTARLVEKGIKIFYGQQKENIKNAKVVVVSSAVKEDNEEIVAARENSIPVIKRSEMLAELMRLKISVAIAGSHGKTTTTSIVASLFEAANKKPTVINGGIINNKNTNAYLGEGDYLIAEADESDATFIKVPSVIGVITNIDPEHLDYYGSIENLNNAFKQFISNLPFFGFGVICKDEDNLYKLMQDVSNRKIYNYGIKSEAQVKAINIERAKGKIGYYFDVIIDPEISTKYQKIENIYLQMEGTHNVSNSLAAILIGLKLGFEENEIKAALASFSGVKRRFTIIDELNNVTFIDDYAHHPREIEATLKTAKEIAQERGGRVLAIMQPHRYSRLHSLFAEFTNCFKDADEVYITEVFNAGEKEIEGANSHVLVEAIKLKYKLKAATIDNEQDITDILLNCAKPNDLVVFMGAGSISTIAYDKVKEIKENLSQKVG